jgi:hypothetical protein
MQIHKSPNETQEEFLARAFRWNKLVGDSFERRQARHSCDCNQGRKPCTCRLIASLDDLPRVDRTLPPMARPMTREELRACGTPLAFGPTYRVSRVRAIWYGAGLVFGAVCIAMAVFGMGQ